MAPAPEFRPTPAQQRLLEGGKVELRGQRSGRRRAIELLTIATAATPEDARLLLEDLHRDGIALQDSQGRRVEPPKRNGSQITYMRFDEEEKE